MEKSKQNSTVTPQVENLDAIVSRVKSAQKEFSTFTQAQVDYIFKKAALAANKARIPLAIQAHEETGRGVIEDKVIKNHYASEYIFNAFKNTKTCGVIEDDPAGGYKRIAEPIGVIAGIVPTTNPTSTAIFKCLLCLKTRNGIIFSPHPSAKKSTVEAARIVLEAAVEAGAPEGIIGWIENPTLELSGGLMNHPDVDLILATGGPGMVRAAYSCGKPAIGVGPGNTPAFIDSTADVLMAVSSIIHSKIFDNGMICASEQAIIAEKSNYKAVKDELIKRGCYFVNEDEKKKLGDFFFEGNKLNAKVVGMSAYQIAKWAGFDVDPFTKILIAECSEIDNSNPFAHEKLSPILGMFQAKDFEDGLAMTKALVNLGGAGHTSALYTATTNKEHMDLFANQVNTGRVLINQPSSQGGIGDIYNFRMPPSLTLGCGSWGKNSVSENVGVRHLLNIKQIAERKENTLWHKIPAKIYFKPGCTGLALRELPGKKAFIVSDKTMEQLGQIKKVTDILDEIGYSYRIYTDVKPDPTLASIDEALVQVNSYQPDTFIALGGGSAIDACKVIWLKYEHPDLCFEDISMRFVDIRKRIEVFPEMGKKAYMCAIASTSGTGSEVTPFAIITDEKTGQKYALADYVFTPNMAIIDPDFVMSMPKSLTAFSGIDAVTHAVESYTSLLSSPFSEAQALESLRISFKHLPISYEKGAQAPRSRELMHYASTMAGIAFSNSFLGICHSMAHKLGARFHIPHGLANALLVNYVIDFSCTEKPVKMGMFAQYEYPCVMERYAAIAEALKVCKDTDSVKDKCRALIRAIDDLKGKVGIIKCIKDFGIEEADFLAALDKMSYDAFDDQCTGAAPRFPLISEIKALYLKAFTGEQYDIMK